MGCDFSKNEIDEIQNVDQINENIKCKLKNFSNVKIDNKSSNCVFQEIILEKRQIKFKIKVMFKGKKITFNFRKFQYNNYFMGIVTVGNVQMKSGKRKTSFLGIVKVKKYFIKNNKVFPTNLQFEIEVNSTNGKNIGFKKLLCY